MFSGDSKREQNRAHASPYIGGVVVFDDVESVYGCKIQARYIKFTAVAGFGEDPHASAAELDVITP